MRVRRAPPPHPASPARASCGWRLGTQTELEDGSTGLKDWGHLGQHRPWDVAGLSQGVWRPPGAAPTGRECGLGETAASDSGLLVQRVRLGSFSCAFCIKQRISVASNPDVEKQERHRSAGAAMCRPPPPGGAQSPVTAQGATDAPLFQVSYQNPAAGDHCSFESREAAPRAPRRRVLKSPARWRFPPEVQLAPVSPFSPLRGSRVSPAHGDGDDAA